MRYQTSVDVANRALQHLGATRIDSDLGFDEASLNASETGFAYDKLRRAELSTSVWRFAIKKAVLRPMDVHTMLLRPTLWSSLTTYFVGHIVVDQNGQMWESTIPDNLGNNPIQSPAWEQYFGPVSVMQYDSTVAYFSGELVYTIDGSGVVRVYRSLENSNTDNPATPTAWDPTVLYFKDQIVGFGTLDAITEDGDEMLLEDDSAIIEMEQSNTTYMSLLDFNIGNDPALPHVPPAWTVIFVGGIGSLKWLQIGGPEFPFGSTIQPPYIIYPIGTGPVSQSPSRSIYRLPAGYLREAPRDPKAGSASYLGAPTNLQYTDWNLENDYIVTRDVDPILFRFVADLTNVRQMTDLFLEYLAARIAMETCQRITQSDTKLQGISNIYQYHKNQSKIANGIETGATEPPLDDYIATRL